MSTSGAVLTSGGRYNPETHHAESRTDATDSVVTVGTDHVRWLAEPELRHSQPPRGFVPRRFADPRRLGAMVGLAGAVVFVYSYTPVLDDQLSTVARVLVVLMVIAGLVLLFAIPQWLGEFVVPTTAAVLVYGVCVLGELLAIRRGSMALSDHGSIAARPALIATAVGVHFLPFAWAFREHMFYWLGGTLLVLGLAGGGAALAGLDMAAPVAAVLSGLAMAAIVTAYAAGAFSHPRLAGGRR
jgi:hypothetical protein